MKFQTEMILSLATLYGYDIQKEEEKKICMMLACVENISQAVAGTSAATASTTFIKLVNTYLKGATLTTVKNLLKQVGITFTKKGLVKGIPMGAGSVASFTINKVTTIFVGQQGKNYFRKSREYIDLDE